MKLGILGAGGIASTMAKTVAGMKDVEAYAVAARDLERARVFAQKYEVKKAYGSYEEMLADDEVGLVYIATPHSHHYLHAKMCLEAGKHVLCEKAFTVNTVLSDNCGGDGMGKTMYGNGHFGTFNSTSEGDFCRLWSCVADASGRVGAVERTDRHFCL